MFCAESVRKCPLGEEEFTLYPDFVLARYLRRLGLQSLVFATI